ncbi:MAG: DUF4412 domain-containing protein [Bacteroidia bacterium]|nr:DUF4412 domain-containing protein [Bacteroidia bacterium]
MRIITTALFLIKSLTSFAQSFEGQINLIRIIGTDTSRYRYYVKTPNIRIEEIDKKGSVQGFIIMNTIANKVYAVSPVKKAWIDVQKSDEVLVTGKVECIKTKETKLVAGVKCTKWAVKNTKEKIMINYWVANNNFDFFIDHLKLLNRKEKLASYFINLPLNQGFIPLEAQQYSKEAGVKEQLSQQTKTTKVERKTIDMKLFVVPTEYRKFNMDVKI